MKYVAIIIALALSTIAGYFSVLGMMEIFPKYVHEIIALTILLEMAKITTAVYLHMHWNKVTKWIKVYLSAAAVTLAVITSLGVYSFLMKSHVDQTVSINGGAVKEGKLLDIERTKLESELGSYESRITLIERASAKKVDTATKSKDTAVVGTDEEAKLKELNNKKQEIVNKLADIEAQKIDVDNKVDSEASIFAEWWFRCLVILIVLTLDPLALSLAMSAMSIETETTIKPKPVKKAKPKLVPAKKKPIKKKPVRKKIKSKPKKVKPVKRMSKPKAVKKPKKYMKLPKSAIVYY